MTEQSTSCRAEAALVRLQQAGRRVRDAKRNLEAAAQELTVVLNRVGEVDRDAHGRLLADLAGRYGVGALKQ